MKKTIAVFIVFVIACISISNSVLAQDPPFYSEIQAFRKQDSVHFPAKNSILFVGSSSFNFWKDMHDYFPGYPLINRGFGGSSLTDVIRYAPDIIYPYEPKQVVIYCGENDLAVENVTPQVVLDRVKTLFNMIRGKFKNLPIVYVSIKPSPSRAHLMPLMVKSNKLIKAFLNRQQKAIFVDVFSKMLQKDGTPRTDIFTNDNLHMNAKGYAIWKKEIESKLVK
jgi:lysophospholipase L1-like esterase